MSDAYRKLGFKCVKFKKDEKGLPSDYFIEQLVEFWQVMPEVYVVRK